MSSERPKAVENRTDGERIWKMLEDARSLAIESSGNENSNGEITFTGTFPTRVLKFPEVDSNLLASNLRNFDAKSALKIWLPDPRRSTISVEIFVGVESGRFKKFKYKRKRETRSVLPKVFKKDKKRSGRLTKEDLESFSAAIEFAKKNQESK